MAFRYTTGCTGTLQLAVAGDSFSYVTLQPAFCTTFRFFIELEVSGGESRTLTVNVGQSYFVRAGVSDSRAFNGTRSLTLTCITPPPNDKPAGAYRIPTDGGLVEYNTYGGLYDFCSVHSPFTPRLFAQSSQSDVWFVWNANCTGIATVTDCADYTAGMVVPYLGIRAASSADLLFLSS